MWHYVGHVPTIIHISTDTLLTYICFGFHEAFQLLLLKFKLENLCATMARQFIG